MGQHIEGLRHTDINTDRVFGEHEIGDHCESDSNNLMGGLRDVVEDLTPKKFNLRDHILDTRAFHSARRQLVDFIRLGGSHNEPSALYEQGSTFVPQNQNPGTILRVAARYAFTRSLHSSKLEVSEEGDLSRSNCLVTVDTTVRRADGLAIITNWPSRKVKAMLWFVGLDSDIVEGQARSFWRIYPLQVGIWKHYVIDENKERIDEFERTDSVGVLQVGKAIKEKGREPQRVTVYTRKFSETT